MPISVARNALSSAARHPGDVTSADEYLAGGGPEEAAEHPQERRLPCAGWPEQGDHLPGIDVEIDAPQGDHLGSLEMVQMDEAEALHVEAGLGARRARVGGGTRVGHRTPGCDAEVIRQRSIRRDPVHEKPRAGHRGQQQDHERRPGRKEDWPPRDPGRKGGPHPAVGELGQGSEGNGHGNGSGHQPQHHAGEHDTAVLLYE